jgi:hypothetical protein
VQNCLALFGSAGQVAAETIFFNLADVASYGFPAFNLPGIVSPPGPAPIMIIFFLADIISRLSLNINDIINYITYLLI